MEERKLGFVEMFATAIHEVFDCAGMILHITKIKGPLTSELLAAGLLSLQQRQPLLRASTISDEDGPYRYQVSEVHSLHASLLRVVKRESDNHWQSIADEELAHDFNANSPFLWRFTFVENEVSGGDHELLLTVHHAISDGISVMRHSHDLLSFLQESFAGQLPQPKPLPLLPPIDAMLTIIKERPQPPAKVDLFRFPFEEHTPLAECRTRTLFTEVDAASMQAFRSRCKQEQSSLNAGLNAAFIWASYQKHKGDTDEANLTIGSAVNLRKECQPEAAPDYFGCFATTLQTVHPINSHTRFWDLARHCHSELKDSIATMQKGHLLPAEFNRIQVEKGMVGNKQNMGKDGFFFGGLLFSNLGRFDHPKEYGPFTIKEMYPSAHHAAGSYVLFPKVITLDNMCLATAYTEGLISRESASSIVDAVVAIIQQE